MEINTALRRQNNRCGVDGRDLVTIPRPFPSHLCPPPASAMLHGLTHLAPYPLDYSRYPTEVRGVGEVCQGDGIPTALFGRG